MNFNKALISGLILTYVTYTTESIAQPITPANDGTMTIVTPSGQQLDITGGQMSRDGANLFHSFDKFGLETGQTANFQSNPHIDNIFGRVVGGNVSIINGLIQVTGGTSNLFLMNPAGIVFGPGASLNVPGDFTATTATSIGFGGNWFNAVGESNWADLVGTPNQFAFSFTPGAIINLSNLNVSFGHNLNLLGGAVSNFGTVTAPGGNITVTAVPGENILKISQPGHLLSLEIATPQLSSATTTPVSPSTLPQKLPELLTGGHIGHSTQIITNADGTVQLTGSNRILNEGEIAATGGQIQLRGDIVENRGLLTVSGVDAGNIRIETRNFLDAGNIAATSFTGKGGEIAINYTGTAIQTAAAMTTADGATGGGNITFNGDAGTLLTTSGTLSATGETGGIVSLFATNIRLLAAQINANGDSGGGEIFIGGDYQGQTSRALNAENTFINPASHLTADATITGDGGKVIVWADESTQFYGHTSARGGQENGNGGFIEVSGKNRLNFAGTANASAPNGQAGTLLLDPKNITIDANTGGGSFPLFDPNPAAGNQFGGAAVVLPNGNIAVASPFDDFNATDAGAVYLFDPQTGALLGQINGAVASDEFGNNGITALTNGNFAFGNPGANIGGLSDAGTVILASGTTGGEINRISGANNGDQFGSNGITALTNGNFVFGNPNADTTLLGLLSLIPDGGTVILANGTTGAEINRISGASSNDQFGSGQIAALTNGNFAFGNPNADVQLLGLLNLIADVGTVVLADGTTGAEINRINGANINDQFGGGAITALTNGNFVFGNPLANMGLVNNAGTVILANGSTGAEISRISGSKNNDQFGSGQIAALTNGNYVFGNPNADNGTTINVGTVILADGSTGTEINRITGSVAGDNFGNDNIFPLSNGNYVFGNPNADVGGLTNNGTVILADGSGGGEIGRVSGSYSNDRFGESGGNSWLELSNGNYVFGNPNADIGGISDAGTVIIADGTNGSEIHRISGVNSGDGFGKMAVSAIPDTVVIAAPAADVDGRTDAGAVIFFDLVNNAEIIRVTGSNGGDALGSGGLTALRNGNHLVASPAADGSGRVQVFVTNPETLTYDYFDNADITIHPRLITYVTDTGTAVTLQANNDITVNSAIVTSAGGTGGDLTLKAGRSIVINGDIVTDNGNLSLLANDGAANGVVDAQRDAGNAQILAASGVTLDAGSGNVAITLSDGSGLGNNDSGDVAIAGRIIANQVTIANNGPSGGNINLQSGATINAAQSLNIEATTGGNINVEGNFTLTAETLLDTSSGGGNITFNGILDGTAGTENLTINSGSGDITFNDAVGNMTALGDLTANSSGNTLFNNTVNAQTVVTDAPGNTNVTANVTTTNTQTYNDAVTLGANVTLTSDNSNITFNNTVDGAYNLTINSGSGDITFNNAVGNMTALGDFTANSSGNTLFNGTVNAQTVVTDAPGNTNITANVTTTNTQTYNDAVTLGANVTLTSDNSNITFNNTVDGAYNLTINSGSGDITFNDAVGNMTALGDFTASSSGNTLFNGTVNAQTVVTDAPGNTNVTANVTGISLVNFQDALRLLADVTIYVTGGDITFGNTVDGTYNLTLQAGGGNVAFNNVVGSSNPLAALTVTGGGVTSINANITGENQLDFTGATGGTMLGSDAILKSNSGDISFNGSAITGPGQILTLSAVNGDISLDAVGADRREIGGLNLRGNNLSLFGNIYSNGGLSFTEVNQVNILGNAVTLETDSDGGSITANAVNGPGSLTVQAGSGGVSLGNVGDNLPLSGLTVEAGNISAATVTATGDVSLNAGNMVNLGSVSASTVNLTGVGDVTTGDVTATSGINITSSGGNVNTANLNTASESGAGGDITLTSNTGEITTRNITTAGATDGGEIVVNANTQITAGEINDRGSSGSGGNVTLDSSGDIQVTWIDTSGATQGGNVDITTSRFFRATGTLTATDGTNASIYTSGSTGGSIIIRHGGNGVTPFVVGDGTNNGTAGAIVSGDNQISSGSFLYTFTQGNIDIISVPEPPPETPPTDNSTPVATPPTDNSTPVATPPTDNSTPVETPPTDNSTPVVTPPTDNSTPVVTPPTDNSTPVVTPPTDNSTPVVTTPTDNSTPVVTTPTDNSTPVVTLPTDNSTPVATPPTDNSTSVATPPTGSPSLPVSPSPSLPVSQSPSLPVSPSPSLPVSQSPSLPVWESPSLPVSPSGSLPVPPSGSLPVPPSGSLPVPQASPVLTLPTDNSTPVLTLPTENSSTPATVASPPETLFGPKPNSEPGFPVSPSALEDMTSSTPATVASPPETLFGLQPNSEPGFPVSPSALEDVTILPGVATEESAPILSTPVVVLEQPKIDIIESPPGLTVASPVGVAATNLDLAEYEVSLWTTNLGFAGHTSMPNFAANGLLSGLGMPDMADDEEILIVENNWEVDLVAAASLVNLYDGKTFDNAGFLTNSSGRQMSLGMNGDGTGQILANSDISSSPKVDLNLAFQSGDIQEIIWNIERKHNEEFENYLGVSAELGRQGIATSSFQSSLKKMESETGQRAAILYVVALADGLQLVVVPPEGKPWRYSVPEADRNTLLATVQMLRDRITDPRQRFTNSYLAPAQQLYRWLIAPVEADLEKHRISTILLSMDAGLRSLPVGALHDGEKFFVEKYSFSLIPSFSLTSHDYQSLSGATLLAMGASDFNEQQPLPAVPVELMAITQQMTKGKSFLNSDFTLSNMNRQRAEGQFPIIHLATHAEFLPGAPSNSYIQLWDEKLPLDQIPNLNWRNPQVELLVLSACRTALGDREAELGFAGLAVKAGVKSAIASLWYVSDEGSLGLMADFYGHLRQNPLKAEALRQAQLDMIWGNIRIENGNLVGIGNSPITLPPSLGDIPNKLLNHPYYWAAFTTIGSPW